MNMFNVLSKTFEQHFQLSPFALGTVSAFYFLSDSILLYPVGVLLDKFSSRGLILMGMLMCIAGTLFMSVADNALFLVVARFLAGTAAAFCLLSILRLAAQWFPAEQMGRISGVVVTIGMLGGAVSQTPLALLIADVGWRYALAVVALLGLIIFAIMWGVVKDAPVGVSFAPVVSSTKADSLGLWAAFKKIISNYRNWVVGTYICTMNLPIMLLAGLFGQQYLVGARGFSPEQGANVSMMIFLGTIVGSTVVGYLTDAMKSRKIPMLYSAIASFALFLVIVFWPSYHYMTALILFFALGFITAAQIIGYALTRESNASSLVGSALGFVSVIIMGLPAILQPLMGYLMQSGHHLGQLSVDDYRRGLSILIIGFVISIICAIVLPETYGQVVGDNQD